MLALLSERVFLFWKSDFLPFTCPRTCRKKFISTALSMDAHANNVIQGTAPTQQSVTCSLLGWGDSITKFWTGIHSVMTCIPNAPSLYYGLCASLVYEGQSSWFLHATVHYVQINNYKNNSANTGFQTPAYFTKPKWKS